MGDLAGFLKEIGVHGHYQNNYTAEMISVRTKYFGFGSWRDSVHEFTIHTAGLR
jgi:hypothetical protein